VASAEVQEAQEAQEVVALALSWEEKVVVVKAVEVVD
jgi:hypothetical protein